MKKIKYLVIAIITSIFMVATVYAEDVSSLSELETCLATSNNTCNLTTTIDITSDVELELNGGNITGLDSVDPLFYVNGGSITIKGTGIITANNDAFFLQGNSTLGGAAIKAEVTIGANVKVISNNANCIYIRGNGSKADVYGSLESRGSYAVIQGNGTKNSSTDHGNTIINIYDGAKIVHENDHAIYHPQAGILKVNGGTIQGVTGIEMRAGELIVYGGTIIGTGTQTTVTPNGNGTSVFGAGIALAQHTTILEASVEILGGTIKGATALYETTPEVPNDSTIITINVNGGNFVGTKDEAIHSDNKEGFITNGTFNKEVDDSLLKTGTVTKVENGIYLTGKENNVVIEKTPNGKVTVDKEKAVAGETVTLTITPDKGYEIDKIIVEDAQGSVIDVKENKFTMAKYDTGVIVTFKESPKQTVTPEIPEVPKTSDNISLYIILGFMSIIISKKIIRQLKNN